MLVHVHEYVFMRRCVSRGLPLFRQCSVLYISWIAVVLDALQMCSKGDSRCFAELLVWQGGKCVALTQLCVPCMYSRVNN